MAIDFEALGQANERFQAYDRKINLEDTEDSILEQRQASQRYRDVFLPAAERLMYRRVSSAKHFSTGEDGIGETGTKVDVPSVPSVAPKRLIEEVIQRENDLRPVRFLHVALLASRSVGRVRVVDSFRSQEGDGTGFLIAPGLLLTNWHVLKSFAIAEASSVIFDDEEGLDGDPKDMKSFRLLPRNLFVADEELDYAVVEVSPRTNSGVPLSQYGFLRLYEQTGKLDPQIKQAANIIQHPGGGPKKVAVRDNYFLPVLPNAHDPEREVNSLYYGTDTLKGSSGSPVCNDQWYVVALHRGGVPKTELLGGKETVVRLDGTPAQENDPEHLISYVANEGTRVSRIYASLREKQNEDPNALHALSRLLAVSGNPELGPIDLRSSPILIPGGSSGGDGGSEEITRRSIEDYKNAKGYKPAFLGAAFKIALPKFTSEVKRELAPLRDSEKYLLNYDNYSLAMNRERRTAFVVAVNVDGAKLWDAKVDKERPKRPAWTYDPRMLEEYQPDDEIFSNTIARGHLYKREDATWGKDRESKIRADRHSFTISNATPMISNFNNVEWGDLEDLVTDELKAGRKVSYFAGPIFRSSDPYFYELTSFTSPSGDRKTGMRIPLSFWKIVAWIDGGKLKAAGFILQQSDELKAHGTIEEIDFGNYKKRRIKEIEDRTGLRFPELLAVDTYGK